MRVELVDTRLHSRNQWLGCWVRKFWSRLTLNFPLGLSKAPGKTLPGVLSGEGGPWSQCYQSLMGKRAEGLHTQHAFIYPIPPFSTRHWWPSVCQVFPVKGLSSPEDKLQCGCVESRWLVSFFWQSGRRTRPVFKQISKQFFLFNTPLSPLLRETSNTADSPGTGRRRMCFTHHLSLEVLLPFFLILKIDTYLPGLRWELN